MAWQTTFMDGFDHYTSNEILQKWTAGSGAGSSITIDSTTYRNSGKSLKIGSSAGVYLAKSFQSSKNLIIAGGFYATAVGQASAVSASNSVIIGVGNALSISGSDGQVAFCFLSDGKIHAARGSVSSLGGVSGSALLGSTTNALPLNQWVQLEIRIYIDDTAGEIEVRVNGAVELSLTGIDTKNLAIDTASSVIIKSSSSGFVYYDDFYVRTGSVSALETGGFLGDVRIIPKYPNADGTYSQMTPSVAGPHYTLVDETTPSTTDYVSSATAGHKDSFGFEDVTESGAVKAVQLNVFAGKDDAGFRGVDLFTKSGATEDYGSYQALSNTVTYKNKVWEKNPNTTMDWAKAELNAAEFGVRISSV